MIQFIAEIPALLKVVGPYAIKLATKLPTIIETALEVMRVAVPIIKKLAEIFGVGKNIDDVEDMGKKTMQEGTRPKMEDESMEEYFDYLRNEVKLDEERWKNMTDEDRLMANIAGVSMMTTAINEKVKVEISPDFIIAMAKMAMSAKELAEYINVFSDNGIDSLDSLTDYLRGELSGDRKKEMHDIVKETEHNLHPDSTNGEILEAIEAMKEKL